MRIIKLFEEYVDTVSAVTILQSLMKGYVKTIKGWFLNGTFSNTEDVVLYDIQYSENTTGIDKSLIFDFTDGIFMYQVILVIRIQDFDKEDGKFKKCMLTVKKYSLTYDAENALQGDLLDEWDSASNGEGLLDLSEFNEDRILEIINELDNENQAIGSNPETNKELGGEQDDDFEETLDEEGIPSEDE